MKWKRNRGQERNTNCEREIDLFICWFSFQIAVASSPGPAHSHESGIPLSEWCYGLKYSTESEAEVPDFELAFRYRIMVFQ